MMERPQGYPSPLSDTVESRPSLLRALGPGMALAMVVGNVIGSGIFVKPGTIAREAGDVQIILTAWIVGGGLCLLGALSMAELAVMMPRAGGLYVYLREAYGRPVAFLAGWTEFLFAKPASIGALSVAVVVTYSAISGEAIGLPGQMVFALTLIFAMAWINILGVIWGGRFQVVATIIKAGLVAFLAALPFLMLPTGSDGIEFANYRSTLTAMTPLQTTWQTKFAAVLLAVMWTYNGWHGVTPIAEEIRDPARNIPRALFWGLGILIALYLSVNVAYHGTLSMNEIAAAGEHVPQAMVHHLLDPISPHLARVIALAVSAGIMCSMIGAINSNTLNGPRISFAMGRDDVFVRGLGRVHATYRTPAVAIVVQALMSAGLVIAAAIRIAYWPSEKGGSLFDLLTDYVVFSLSIFYVLAVAAVFVLRWRRPEWERPYRTPGYPFVPAVYVIFYLWFLTRIYSGQPVNSQAGLALIALGIPFYFAWNWWSRRHPEVMDDGV